MQSNDDEYQRQVRAQIQQYAGVGEMHVSSDAAHFLNTRYLNPRLASVFGSTDIVEIYGQTLVEALTRTGRDRILSLGAGYGALEINVVRWMKDHHPQPFRLIGTDLSPELVDRAREAARAAGLTPWLSFEVADLNSPFAFERPVAGVMINHAIHHFVELEHIFSEIDRLLCDEGVFVSYDMIGRNGHMRWPETLGLTRELWAGLPRRYKWNHQRNRFFDEFDNWDCSIEGFEGIRAQDILYELLRRFRFEKFVANLGLTDVFISPGFGPNFDLNQERDVRFLDEVQKLEDRLVEAGEIKPIQMFAVMRTLRSASCPAAPRVYRSWTPERSLRPPAPLTPARIPSLDGSGFVNPYADEVLSRPLSLVDATSPVAFGRNDRGPDMLRWGWCDPEEALTWSSGIDCAIEFQTDCTTSRLDLVLLPYRVPKPVARSLLVRVNGVPVIDLPVSDGDLMTLRLPIPRIGARERVLIEITDSRPRRPDVDGGDDKRPIGFGLITLALAAEEAQDVSRSPS